MSPTKKATTPTSRAKASDTWSDVEREAAQETVRERKRQAKRSPAEERTEGEKEVLAKIAEMQEPDKSMATRIHALVTDAAPDLVPRTFYGMPAYAKNGKVICFFQSATKFKVRYATFGFQPEANLDAGTMWPVGYALEKLTPANEKEITALVKKAAS
jgi:uncharacterized protein YdhG (YjbR/CyaY superfamily)